MTTSHFKNKVSLRQFSAKHIAQTFEWVNDRNLQKLFLIRGNVTWDGHLRYWEKILSDDTQKVYAIYSASNHVGNCGLKNLNLNKKEGELWIYIGNPQMRRKGIGREALKLLLANAVSSGNLSKIIVHLAQQNKTATDLYKKFGFTEVALPETDTNWSNRCENIIRMELNTI